jgi:hypothetical protein
MTHLKGLRHMVLKSPLESFNIKQKHQDFATAKMKWIPDSHSGLDPWFDRPFDRLMVLSKVEGLTTLSEVEGESIAIAPCSYIRMPGQTRHDIVEIKFQAVVTQLVGRNKKRICSI